jgi:hypothetical protein
MSHQGEKGTFPANGRGRLGFEREKPVGWTALLFCLSREYTQNTRQNKTRQGKERSRQKNKARARRTRKKYQPDGSGICPIHAVETWGLLGEGGLDHACQTDRPELSSTYMKNRGRSRRQNTRQKEKKRKKEEKAPARSRIIYFYHQRKQASKQASRQAGK